MTDYWANYETVGGKFDPKHRSLVLDYGSHVDSDAAYAVFAHEMMHAQLCTRTEYGQATELILNTLPERKDLTETEKKEIESILVKSQIEVQESLAILFQCVVMMRRIGRVATIKWARDRYSGDYLSRFNRIEFLLSMSEGYRNEFINKAQVLSMETSFRKDAKPLDLLKKPSDLANYLNIPNNNPNERFLKLLETVRHKNWLPTKSYPEVARLIGITHNGPSTKEAVADCVNYCFALIGKQPIITASDVQEIPNSRELIDQMQDDMVIANLNLNLADDGDWMWKPQDFLDYTDHLEVIMPLPHFFDPPDVPFLKSQSGQEPETGLMGLNTDKKKYLTTCTLEFARDAINNQFSGATYAVKSDAYLSEKYQMLWEGKYRKPDLVIYARPSELHAMIERELATGKKFKVLMRGARFTENSPYHTLMLQIDGKGPIHWLNSFGDKGIQPTLDLIRSNSLTMSVTDMRERKKHINNALAFWNNLMWEVDWVESMNDKTRLFFRDEYKHLEPSPDIVARLSS